MAEGNAEASRRQAQGRRSLPLSSSDSLLSRPRLNARETHGKRTRTHGVRFRGRCSPALE